MERLQALQERNKALCALIESGSGDAREHWGNLGNVRREMDEVYSALYRSTGLEEPLPPIPIFLSPKAPPPTAAETEALERTAEAVRKLKEEAAAEREAALQRERNAIWEKMESAREEAERALEDAGLGDWVYLVMEDVEEDDYYRNNVKAVCSTRELAECLCLCSEDCWVQAVQMNTVIDRW